MILLTLQRLYLKPEYTIGKLYLRGNYFCDTLEDAVRDLNKDGDLEDFGEYKVYGETAIPYGRYKVVVTYSPKFKRELPLLLDVKHFTGTRMHRGRFAKDTAGCVLTGKNTAVGQLSESAVYEKRLTAMLKAYGEVGEEIFIDIV